MSILAVGFSKATSRAANHMSLWPASSSQPASSRPWASNRPLPRWSIAVPRMSSWKCFCMSPGLEEPDVRAVALDGADAGEGGDERLGHAGLDEVAGLGDVGHVLGPGLERDVEHLLAEQRGVLRLPRLDGGHPELRAGGDVGALRRRSRRGSARRRR